MQQLIVHITDPGKIDESVAVKIASGADLGRAVHAALEIVFSKRHRKVAYPLFIDIHPVDGFEHVEQLYKVTPTRPSGPN